MRKYYPLILLLSLLTNAVLAAVPAPPGVTTSLAPMLKQAMPAVVNILVQGEVPNYEKQGAVKPNRSRSHSQPAEPRKFEGIGSGVIVDPKQGYILTNAHVLKDAKVIKVTLHNGHHTQAKLIGTDPESDVAVLQIKSPNLTTIKVGDSSQLQVGDYVVAIGNPFGLNLFGPKQTATFGIISALRRGDIGIEGYEDFIQTDAAINPGNSGGALLNLKGELIGINTAIITPGRGSVGIGLAIPINMAKRVMQQLIKYGSVHRGLMGIMVQPLTPSLASAFGTPNQHGAVITQVNNESPAEKAGLKVGDIITEINGEKITDAGQVKNNIGLMRVGDHITISFLRNGTKQTITTAIADPAAQEKHEKLAHPYLFGLALKNLKQHSPLHGDVEAVQIVGIQEHSPAWIAGMRFGDVIDQVNHKPVTSVEALRKVASNNQGPMLVHVLRGHGSLFFVVK